MSMRYPPLNYYRQTSPVSQNALCVLVFFRHLGGHLALLRSTDSDYMELQGKLRQATLLWPIKIISGVSWI